MNEASTRILASLLESRTGQQLAMTRRWRIETALTALMRERGLGNIDQLIASVVTGQEPQLAELVVEALLNNETYFFRDRTPFDTLLNGPLEQLREQRARQKRISIWSAGCSTGQEAYSLAMSFADDAARWAGWTIDIVGTDVSRSAVDRAKQGRYSQFEVQRGLPVKQMIRWFSEEEGQNWRIADDIRRSVRFQAASLTGPPPAPGQFDIILCRNVLLYFTAPMRKAVFARLAEAARPDAVLMLGAGETVIGQTDAFAADVEHRGLYKKMSPGAEVKPRRYSAG